MAGLRLTSPSSTSRMGVGQGRPAPALAPLFRH
jgi:hypothetical protein